MQRCIVNEYDRDDKDFNAFAHMETSSRKWEFCILISHSNKRPVWTRFSFRLVICTTCDATVKQKWITVNWLCLGLLSESLIQIYINILLVFQYLGHLNNNMSGKWESSTSLFSIAFPIILFDSRNFMNIKHIQIIVTSL